MARIFLSYRRSDSGGHSRLLAQDLERHYPGDVFRDVEVIDDGDRWDQVIRKQLEECEALLAVIGPEWLTARDVDSGQRRIDMEEDWVRREIETALARGVPVIPVLVGGAPRLNASHRLPRSLQSLTAIEPREISARDAADDAERLAVHLKRRIGPATTTATQPAALRAPDPLPYLRWLEAKTARIDIRGLATGQTTAHSFPIEELYTPLTTLVPLAMGGSTRVQQVTLGDAVRQLQRLVLVGDPGSGKSTFLRRIAHAAAHALTGTNESKGTVAEFFGDGSCPLPILASAAAVSAWLDGGAAGNHAPAAEHSPEYLIRYLEAASAEQGWPFTAEYFRGLFRGDCLLLLDGLDEAPDRRRRKNLSRLVEETAVVYPQLRIVATTRPSAYGGEVSLAGFASAHVQPLDRDAIRIFVRNWSRLVRPDAPDGYAASLEEAIGSGPEMTSMAGNPVMLTALAVLHWNERRLPERRNELYDSILKWLVRAREDVPRRLPAERCLELIRALAFGMQTDPRGRLVEITPHAAAVLLMPLFVGQGEGVQYESAAQFLSDEETNTGILIARNEGLRFWHLSFQEYLAAHVLAVRSAERKRLLFDEQRLYLPDWRETVLLLAGILRSLDKQLVDDLLSALLDGIGPDAPLAHRARSFALIGSILSDLASSGYEFADARWQAMLASMKGIFTAEWASAIDLRTRLDAALAMARLSPLLAVEAAAAAQDRPPLSLQSGNLECVVRSERAPVFGGDYHELLHPDQDHLCVVAADWSGKGVRPALFDAELQAYFQGLPAAEALDPARVLRDLNDRFMDSESYATVFYGVYASTTGRLVYANSGYPYPACMRASGETEMLECPGVPLGVFAGSDWEVQGFQLYPGDLLGLFSDGLIEAMGDDGEEFGVTRVLEALEAHPAVPLDELASATLATVRRFAPGPQEDDRTLILLRIRHLNGAQTGTADASLDTESGTTG